MSTASASPLPQHLASSSSAPCTSPQANARSKMLTNGSPQQPTLTSPRASSPKTSTTGLVDLELLLKSHGGDPRRALEALVVDRNTLQAQNAQLWKLVEKQRTQCASLASDVDRLRGDRERANARLAAVGLEPVSHAKKMSTSSSAVGLVIRPDPQSKPRRNSDRDERSLNPTLRVPSPSSSSQGSLNEPPALSFSSPWSTQSQSQSHELSNLVSPTVKAPSSLLPSPLSISDSKTRRESHMVFPPEVTSFMTLVESPKEPQHIISPLPPTAEEKESPVTPVTASGLSFASAPPSSRPAAQSPESLEEEVLRDENTARSENPPTPESAPQPPRVASLVSPIRIGRPLLVSASSDTSLPSYKENERGPGDESTSAAAATSLSDLKSDQKVDLSATPNIAPALLPHTRLTIPSSTVFPNALGRDVLCFIVSITTRPPNAPPITWTVAKLFSAFIDLDGRIKTKSGKSRKELKAMIAPLPDSRAWKDFAPSKIDQRKKALETYLQSLLIAPLVDKTDLCAFLNTDKVKAREHTAWKDGYLTKKGKNFGGWKTRYFVLDGPTMEYYETRGGSHLGSITITNAQIGRQTRPNDSSDDRDFRHAFLIIEQGRRERQRHVLCAESDMERDSWIENLVRHVDPEPAASAAPILSPPPLKTPTRLSNNSAGPTKTPGSGPGPLKRSNSRKLSKDVVVTAAQPMAGLSTVDNKFGGAPSPSLINSMESKRATQQIASASSVPAHMPHPSTSSQASSTAGASTLNQATPTRTMPYISNPMAMVSSPGDLFPPSPPDEVTPRANKRQSIMPGRSAPPPQSHSAAYLNKVASEGLTIPGMESRDKERERKAKSGRFWPSFGKTPEKVSRPVFGVPLAESIAVASKASLPAIVFRCIEYLEGKHAETEEGLYRLSGSSAVIKGLKERFNHEGDVDLLKIDERWDPHAVAGLLKTFLRELPSSLLTRDLHTKFLAVMDLIESSARVAELSRLVSELPSPNYALLRALTAHLILIVRNSTVNKMTLRNIGIVFSPTLGIPAGIFSELVSNFGAIFDDEDLASPITLTEASGLASGEADIEETVKRKRNSMLYQAGGADTMLGLGGRSLDPAFEDSSSEAGTDLESEGQSQASDDVEQESVLSPREGGQPSAAAARQAKATARAAEKGLTLDTPMTAASLTPLIQSGVSEPPASPHPVGA